MADYKIVYAIVEKGARRHWLRIGLAFVNRDGSLNVRLDALPLSGQLQIRNDVPRSESSDEQATPSESRPHTKESP
jgi:hypothetical protein